MFATLLLMEHFGHFIFSAMPLLKKKTQRKNHRFSLLSLCRESDWSNVQWYSSPWNIATDLSFQLKVAKISIPVLWVKNSRFFCLQLLLLLRAGAACRCFQAVIGSYWQQMNPMYVIPGEHQIVSLWWTYRRATVFPGWWRQRQTSFHMLHISRT